MRLAEAFEVMRCIGWHDGLWNKEGLAKACSDDPLDFVELVYNMAGNAWSAHHFAPVHMSLISTIGTFSKGLACEECDEEDTEDAPMLAVVDSGDESDLSIEPGI